MQEHIGRYNDFANFLANNGYIVVGHDHLGHGNTAKCEDDLDILLIIMAGIG